MLQYMSCIFLGKGKEKFPSQQLSSQVGVLSSKGKSGGAGEEEERGSVNICPGMEEGKWAEGRGGGGGWTFPVSPGLPAGLEKRPKSGDVTSKNNKGIRQILTAFQEH